MVLDKTYLLDYLDNDVITLGIGRRSSFSNTGRVQLRLLPGTPLPCDREGGGGGSGGWVGAGGSRAHHRWWGPGLWGPGGAGAEGVTRAHGAGAGAVGQQ